MGTCTGPSLRNSLTDSCVVILQKPSGSGHKTYAIKTYTTSTGSSSSKRDAKQHFQDECNAFQRITEAGARRRCGIVEFYASFVYNGSFNLILEFADQGTLEDLFKKPKPASGKSVLAFWENMFEIIKGVFWIHDHYLLPDKANHPVLEQGFVLAPTY